MHFAANPAWTQNREDSKRPATPWRPQLYFGTVNFNDQLTELKAWKNTASRVDGMLLHLHFFVRNLDTPGNRKVENAEQTIRKIAPNLTGKPNILELTFHIRSASTSPEEIARTHAKNIADLETAGIPVAGINVDWILSILDVQAAETSRTPGETDDAYGTRVLEGAIGKSARYMKEFRAQGRDEKLYAVFPPVYVDEGRWVNVRKAVRHGITVSRILSRLFDAGFAGFTADSPYFVLSNPVYKSAGYYDALSSIENTCRQRGKSFGFIVTGDNKESGEAYDARFAKTSLDAFNLVYEAGLRPDQIISESWYKGPFRLVPESLPGTYTYTVLQLADHVGK